jgi:hypothetical protein
VLIMTSSTMTRNLSKLISKPSKIQILPEKHKHLNNLWDNSTHKNRQKLKSRRRKRV